MTIQFETERTLLVGERRWPVSESNVTDTSLFYIRQAVVVFESGWAASIIWGTGTYSDNYDHWWEGGEFVETPERVEVALLHFGTLHIDPRGWVDAESLNALLDELNEVRVNQ